MPRLRGERRAVESNAFRPNRPLTRGGEKGIIPEVLKQRSLESYSAPALQIYIVRPYKAEVLRTVNIESYNPSVRNPSIRVGNQVGQPGPGVSGRLNHKLQGDQVISKQDNTTVRKM